MPGLLELDPYLAITEEPPPGGDDRLRALLAWAVLAPSPHNTQPWSWSVRDGIIDLRADNSRLLPVCDPDGRELHIGCGAALEYLLLRLGLDGVPVDVEILPDADDRDVLARVRTGSGQPYENHPDLIHAMATRRTNRTAYHGDPMGQPLRSLLEGSCARFGIELRWLADEATRAAIVQLIMESDREQMSSREFRHELAQWMRPKNSASDDGMAADLLGQRGVAAYVAPLVVRTFDVGKMQAARDQQLTEGSPDLAALWTRADDATSWLATGRALAHVTLLAESAGRASAYMNQPCELPAARQQLARQLKVTNPQLLLRFGLAEPVHAASRLPVADVLTD